MDKVEHYRTVLTHLLKEYAELPTMRAAIRREGLIDVERNTFQMLVSGWHDERRTFGIVFHLALRDGKIWVECDGTEVGVATLLEEAGVPREDIVLGFRSPFMRQFTDFAVG